MGNFDRHLILFWRRSKSVLLCLIYLFRKHIDEWLSLHVSEREKLATVPKRLELRQLAPSHCSKPLPTLACSYYYIVKMTLPECLECLAGPFILAAQINTSKQNALRGGKDRIHHVLRLWKFNRRREFSTCFFSKKCADNDVLSLSSWYVCQGCKDM